MFVCRHPFILVPHIFVILHQSNAKCNVTWSYHLDECLFLTNLNTVFAHSLKWIHRQDSSSHPKRSCLSPDSIYQDPLLTAPCPLWNIITVISVIIKLSSHNVLYTIIYSCTLALSHYLGYTSCWCTSVGLTERLPDPTDLHSLLPLAYVCVAEQVKTSYHE